MTNAGGSEQININPQAVSESIRRLKGLSFDASHTANRCVEHNSRAQNVLSRLRGLGDELNHLIHEDVWRDLGFSELAGDIWNTGQRFNDALSTSKDILHLLTETHPGKLVPKLENEFAPLHARLANLHAQAEDASNSAGFRQFLDLIWSDALFQSLNSLAAGAWMAWQEIETLISVQEWLLLHEEDLINLGSEGLYLVWNVRDVMHLFTKANTPKNDSKEDAFRTFDDNYDIEKKSPIQNQCPIQIGEVTGLNGQKVVVVQLLGVDGIVNGRANNFVDAGLVGLGIPIDPYYADAQAAINKYLSEQGLNAATTQVIIEGHSMGGMEAQELAARSSFNIVGVYTYGSPNLHLSHGHAHVYQMYAHQNDIVPHLLPQDQNDRRNAAVATRVDQILTGSSSYSTEYQHYSGVTIIGGNYHDYDHPYNRSSPSQVVRFFTPAAAGFRFSVSDITHVKHYTAPI